MRARPLSGGFAGNQLALGMFELGFHTGGNETILGIDHHVTPFEVFHLATRAMQQRSLEMVAVSQMLLNCCSSQLGNPYLADRACPSSVTSAAG